MNKEKAIEVLEDLKCYVNENWDETEHKKEIDEADQAISIAVSILKQSSVCGFIKLNNEKYNIVKIDW